MKYLQCIQMSFVIDFNFLCFFSDLAEVLPVDLAPLSHHLQDVYSATVAVINLEFEGSHLPTEVCHPLNPGPVLIMQLHYPIIAVMQLKYGSQGPRLNGLRPVTRPRSP